MRRRVKITLLCITGALGLAIVLVTAFCFFLRTPSGSRFVLAQARRILASSQIRMDYQEGALDPFSFVHFRNLKLTQKTGDVQMEVFIPAIEIRYRIALLARSVEVEKALIDRPSILFHSATKIAAPAEETPVQKPAGDPMESARRMVLSPPVKLTVKEFALEGMKLDLDYETPEMVAKASLASLGMHARLAFLKNTLSADGDFALNEGSTASFTSRRDRARLVAEAAPAGTAKWAISVRSENGKWVYELKPTEARFDSKHVGVLMSDASASTHLDLNGLSLESHLRLLARTTELFKLDRNSVETMEITNTLGGGRVLVEQEKGLKKTALSIDSESARCDGTLGQDLSFRTSLMLENIFSRDLFVKPSRLEASANAHLARDLTQFTAKGETVLGAIRLLAFDMGSEAAAGLSWHAKAEALADPRLATVMRLPASFRQLGALHALLGARGKVNGPIQSFVDVSAATLQKATADGVVETELTQDRRPKGAGLSFDPLMARAQLTHDAEALGFKITLAGKSLQYDRSRLSGLAMGADGSYKGGVLQAKVTAAIPEVRSNFLKKPWAIGLDTGVEWEGAKDRVAAEGTMKIDREDAVHYKIDSLLKEEAVKLDATVDALVGNYLEGFLTRAQFNQFGKWRAKTQLALTLRPPKGKNASFLKDGAAQGGGTTIISQLREPGNDRYLFVLPEPITVTHKIALDRGKTDVTIEGEMPSFEMPKMLKMAATRFSSRLVSPDLAAGRDFDFAMDMNQGQFTLSRKLAARMPPLAGAEMKLKASVRNQDAFRLENLTAGFNHSMLALSAEASGKMKTKDFQMRGTMVAEVPRNFPAVADQTIQGRIEFPWSLIVRGGREMGFEGTMKLGNLGWAKPPARVAGISGSVPVSEKLVFDGKRVHFSYLITQNPFERVDYERLRPLINAANQVRIKEIGFEDKTYGPFVGYFSMRQNMLFAHQFDLNLGTTGLAYGEMYFDVYPANLQMGFLSRLTNLNLIELLPKKYLVTIVKGDKNLSGRSGIVLNLNKGSVDGRVDITEIGGSQLITLINVLDPKYEDDKMNLARTALGIGYPTFVQMKFQQGYLDLDMDIHALGITKNFPVPGIPISPFLTSASADILKKTQEGPLQ